MLDVYRELVDPKPIHCRECGKATKGGKPYCKDHLEYMPYVRKLRG